MKDKKKLYIKISLAVVVLLSVILIVVFSPNIIKRLRGNTVSVNTLNEGKNTGVIITNDILLNKTDNQINLKLYNGSGKEITVNKYIYKQASNGGDPYTEVDIDPLVIANDQDGVVTIDNASSLFSEFNNNGGITLSVIEVGILYQLDGENYKLVTSNANINNFNPDLINTDETYSKQIASASFVIASSDDGVSGINIELNKNKVVLDKSENLSKAGLTYTVSSSSDLVFENPLSTNSLTKNIFGQANTSNIADYFNYNGESDNLTSNGLFALQGSPKSVVSNEVIIPGLYFTKTVEDVVYSSELETPFSGDLPNFTLTIYDKSELNKAIVSAYEKLYSFDEENTDIDSFNNYFNILNSALDMYYSRYEYETVLGESKEIVQSEIDSMVSTLNDTQIDKKQAADYSKLNAIIEKVNALNASYYSSEEIAEIRSLVSLKQEGLTSNYQVKIDNLTSKITAAFDSLEMLPADWTEVDEALVLADEYTKNVVPNTNTQLYTTESWKALTDAKTAANKKENRAKKIDEQDTINGYATSIISAIENLEKLPANYDDIDYLIEDYNKLKALNYLQTDKLQPIEEYLNNIDRTKKIDEQSYVNDAYETLYNMVIDAIKIANGIYKEPYYMGGKSIEGIYEFAINADPNDYEDEGKEVIEEIKSSFASELYVIVDGQKYEVLTDSSGYTNAHYVDKDGKTVYVDTFERTYLSFEEFLEFGFGKEDILITNQNNINDVLTNMYYYVDSLPIKPGDYTELCKYYSEILGLNKEFYENYDIISDIIWDLSWDYKKNNQNKIDDQATLLKNALNSLKLKKADTTNLEKIYLVAQSLNENNYLNFSGVKTLMTKYDTVKNTTIDKQAVVDELANKLSSEISKLQLKEADYSKIISLQSKISQLDASKYSNFTIVTEALGKIVYGKKIDEQDAVNTMYSNLKTAYDSLIKKSDNIADYSKLRTYLSKIPADYSEYSNELQEEIKLVLKDAKALPTDLMSDKQSQIDALTERIVSLLIKLNVDIYETESSAIVLSYLKVNDEKVDITTVPFKYTVSYDTLEAKIDVGLSSKDSTSKVFGGGVILPGENIITIQVTAKDGTIYNYKLIINRKSTSDYLSDLSIKNTSIEFNKTKQEYTVKIDKNTDKLDLSAITEDENASVKIIGNEDLKNGSKVTIEVTSADGSVRIYTLDIQKAGSVDVKVILVLIIILALLAGIFKVIQKKNKENNA